MEVFISLGILSCNLAMGVSQIICSVHVQHAPGPVPGPCSCMLWHQTCSGEFDVCLVQHGIKHRKVLPRVIKFWWGLIWLITEYEPPHIFFSFKLTLVSIFFFYSYPHHSSFYRARQSNFLVHRKFQHFKTCFSSVLDITSFHIRR